MEKELKDMIKNLSDSGCEGTDVDMLMKLYANGQTKELIRLLKRCRCVLMDEMHKSQRKVDRMDLLIRKTEKSI